MFLGLRINYEHEKPKKLAKTTNNQKPSKIQQKINLKILDEISSDWEQNNLCENEELEAGEYVIISYEDEYFPG